MRAVVRREEIDVADGDVEPAVKSLQTQVILLMDRR
jgi:hypothetical protein